MRRYLIILFSLFLAPAATAQDAREIVKKADDKARGNTSTATMTIQTVRPSWQREMTVKAWSKGRNLSLILINSPQKDKGIVYLKRSREVWNWLPSIDRNIKMPPSMMNQSWMGTDFKNDDLVREASIVDDYTHKITGETTVDGRKCYQIELTPKPQAAVVWGKVVLAIDKKDNLILHGTYYDEDGTLVNTIHASDIKSLGGRMLPSRMEVIPADKKGHKTVLIYQSLVFDKPIEDAFFSVNNMPKVK